MLPRHEKKLREGGIDMENDLNAIVDGILARETGRPTDSKTLLEQQVLLKEGLKASMVSGEAERLVRIREELRELPDFILAAEVHEIRAKLQQIEIDLAQAKADEKALEELRGIRNAELVPVIEQYERAQVAVSRVEASLYHADATRQRLLESRRELKAKLQNLIGEINDENRN